MLDIGTIEAQIRAFPESEATKMCWYLLGGYQEVERQRAALDADFHNLPNLLKGVA